MNISRIFFIIGLLLLVGCATPTATLVQQPVAPPTNTDLPNPTSTIIQTSTATQAPLAPKTSPTVRKIVTPTLPPERTQTQFIETYPLKQVWIRYGLGGFCCSYFGAFDNIFNIELPTFVIYTDKQMILSHGDQPLLEKILSNDEICNLLDKLDSLGLNQINSSGINPDDPIYLDQARENWGTDAPYIGLDIIGESPKNLAIYDPVKDFVIQPVKDIMNFLNQYRPSDMKPYNPDRLAICVQPGRMFDELKNQDAITWPKNVTPLSENVNNGLYLDGDAATQIYKLFARDSVHVYTDQGVEYTVGIRPVLPDEVRGGATIDYSATPQFVPPFRCKK